MPQRVAQLSVADNLCKLASEFQSGDPAMAGAIRKEFKAKSKNDLSRIVVYLMEVIGSRDEQFKAVQSDNKDLKEILKLNDINLEEEYGKLNDKEKANATNIQAKENTGAVPQTTGTTNTTTSPGRVGAEVTQNVAT